MQKSELEKPFREITEFPENFTACNVINRLIDGLGFRFHWATDGLRGSDFNFSPAQDMMTISELIAHIYDLVFVSLAGFHKNFKKNKPTTPKSTIDGTLFLLQELKKTIHPLQDQSLKNYTIRKLPLWHMINGPLSDALTHVGQINSFRRINGNPIAPVNFFSGKIKKS